MLTDPEDRASGEDAEGWAGMGGGDEAWPEGEGYEEGYGTEEQVAGPGLPGGGDEGPATGEGEAVGDDEGPLRADEEPTGGSDVDEAGAAGEAGSSASGDGEAYRARRVARRPRRARRRRALGALVGVLIVALVVGIVSFVHVSNEVNPPGRPGPFVTVKIPSGASSLRIADLLAKAGVVHGPDVFELYLKLEGGGPLLAGTYHLRTNEAYSAVIAELEKGPVIVTFKLVVPEGFTVRQIARAVGALHAGISAGAFLAAADGDQVRAPYEPAGTDDLEGMLFPATYPVPQGETPDELVEWMVSTFDAHASQLGLAAAAKRLHYSPYQVIEVASIVEREAKLDQDRGPIASAIYNRLARGIPIGAESTLLYGLGDPTGPVDVTEPNPYNTLVNKGLPPTPISNPGIPSLQAAMSPPKTSYIYWVEVKPDGKMGFASTAAQFKQLQRECRAARLC